jgi:hypothetical protein
MLAPSFLPATDLSRGNDFTLNVLRHSRYWHALLQQPACNCKFYSSANSSVHARQPETPRPNLINNVGSILRQALSTSVNLRETSSVSSVVKTGSLPPRTRRFHRGKGEVWVGCDRFLVVAPKHPLEERGLAGISEVGGYCEQFLVECILVESA